MAGISGKGDLRTASFFVFQCLLSMAEALSSHLESSLNRSISFDAKYRTLFGEGFPSGFNSLYLTNMGIS